MSRAFEKVMSRSVSPRSSYMIFSMSSMSELSSTRKLFGYCTAKLSSCRTDTQKPWNVLM